MNKLRLLISDSVDPWFNIAVEDCIFSQMQPTQRVLFLWRNADTVIIGRAQNPWKECNTKRMDQDQVKLARRRSGGGAVFQDLNNTCFTFMAGKPEYNKEISTNIVLTALKNLGINATTSGRNDMVVDLGNGPRKISGSAYRETADRGFHHGTLLLNTDLTRLANYLNPDPKKLQSKGISSVRSRVANLNEIIDDINHQQVCQAIIDSFFNYYGEQVAVEYISPDITPNLPNFSEQFAKQSSWQWNFGHAPAFTHLLDERFVWGGVDLHFDIEHGKFIRAQVFTDSLNPTPLEDLAQQIIGVNYRPSEIASTLCKIQSQHPEAVEFIEFSNWLVEQLK